MSPQPQIPPIKVPTNVVQNTSTSNTASNTASNAVSNTASSRVVSTAGKETEMLLKDFEQRQSLVLEKILKKQDTLDTRLVELFKIVDTTRVLANESVIEISKLAIKQDKLTENVVSFERYLKEFASNDSEACQKQFELLDVVVDAQKGIDAKLKKLKDEEKILTSIQDTTQEIRENLKKRNLDGESEQQMQKLRRVAPALATLLSQSVNPPVNTHVEQQLSGVISNVAGMLAELVKVDE